MQGKKNQPLEATPQAEMTAASFPLSSY